MAAADVERATHARQWSSHQAPETTDAPAPDRILADGDEVVVGGLRFRVIAVPGHTPGGIVLAGVEGSEAQGLAFVGDTIFAGSVGRTDLAGGDYEQLMTSLARLMRELPDETVLCCGHGCSTTMGRERRANPFLRGLDC
jgi:glyoxylase-like metal-dependent hydrolase (beta-lactamase superfamily II)